MEHFRIGFLGLTGPLILYYIYIQDKSATSHPGFPPATLGPRKEISLAHHSVGRRPLVGARHTFRACWKMRQAKLSLHPGGSAYLLVFSSKPRRPTAPDLRTQSLATAGSPGRH